ncbi:MAG: hypothetical protein ACYC1U_04535 [Candidatus Aquicultorales bacterium]
MGELLRLLVPEVRLVDCVKEKGWIAGREEPRESQSHSVNGALARLSDLIVAFLSIVYYGLFAIGTLFLLAVPFISLKYIEEAAIVGSEKPQTLLTGFLLMGALFYIAILSRRFGYLYARVPVLLPALRMAFIMALSMGAGALLFDLRAAGLLIPRWAAVAAAAGIFLAGRAIMSFWFSRNRTL